MTQEYLTHLGNTIVGCAIEVHRHLGPGLLESVYHACFRDELERRGMRTASQVDVPIAYKGRLLASPLRLDLLVEDLIIVEIKAVEAMLPVFKAQLLSYLRLAGKPKGLLINFNSENIAASTTSMVTPLFSALPKS